MQEKYALSHTPKRGGAEHVAGGLALRDVIRKFLAHVVNQQVGVRVHCQILQRRGLALRLRNHGPGMATHAANSHIVRVRAK